MQSSVKFPIRRKILLLMLISLLGTTVLYLMLSTRLFEQDQRQLALELNLNKVRQASQEIDHVLTRLRKEVNGLARMNSRDAARQMNGFSEVLGLQVFTTGRFPDQWRRTVGFRDEKFLNERGVDLRQFSKLEAKAAVPFSRVLKNGTWIQAAPRWNGQPLFFQYAVAIQTAAGARAVIFDIKNEVLQKAIDQPGRTRVVFVDSVGHLLAASRVEDLEMDTRPESSPFVADALSGITKSQAKRFELGGAPYIGAFSQLTSGRAVVLAATPESELTLASRQLLLKTLLLGSLLLTISLLISLRFSQSITSPLRRLLEATERIARWDFWETVHVTSKDEIGNLATAFNSMATDLQSQRRQLDGQRDELEKQVKARTAEIENLRKQTSKTQSGLVESTRFAALGEVAGKTAHEVLNPVNNMGIRIQKMKQASAPSDDLTTFSDIVSGWQKALNEGGIESLSRDLQQPADGYRNLGEEDIANLAKINKNLDEKLKIQSEDLQFLDGEIQKITHLINQMRTMARAKTERRTLDVAEPVRQTELAMKDQLEEAHVLWVFKDGGGIRSSFLVEADAGEMIQVLTNLTRNSLFAMKEAKRREGRIELELTREGDQVHLSFKDNGTGIPENLWPKIFDSDFTTKNAEDGTGLGLGISRRIIRAFGGDLVVSESIHGKGTTFLLTLPKSTQ